MNSAPAEHDVSDYLGEQLAFIEWSCAAFDDGRQMECKRIATHIRVLLHDSEDGRGWPSLLQFAGFKEDMEYADGTVKEQQDRAIAGHAGGFWGGLVVTRMSRDGTDFVPRFSVGGIPSRMVSFGEWWRLPVMVDTLGQTFSRRNLVLWLANKDGAIHADRLPATYRKLTREASMGVPPNPAEPNSPVSPVPAAIRQIAQELLYSIGHFDALATIRV